MKQKIKLLSLFSGIGAFETALERLGIDYELTNFCEIDKYAVQSYCMLHDVDESLNLGDITNINFDKLPDNIDLLTHGSPCQDYSVSGAQAGGDEGSGTRSSLMWNTVEIVKNVKPKFVIWENVKNVLSPKHKHNFDKYVNILDEVGYTSYYKVINSKDFNVPQNRERIFVISIRKDIDNGQFKFPEPIGLNLRLKDVLEDNVDEKYYLKKEKVEAFLEKIKDKLNFSDCFKGKVVQIGNCMPGKNRANPNQGRVYDQNGIAPTLTTTGGGNRQPMIIVAGNINPSNKGQNGNVYMTDGLSPTLTTNKGEGIKIIESLACASRGRYNDDGIIFQNLEINETGCSNTLTTVLKDNYILESKVIIDDTYANREPRIYDEYSPALRAERSGFKTVDYDLRIRKLTPKEYSRLQGFSDEDFDKIVGISNSQLYKIFGNSISVPVLEAIFRNLFKAKEIK